MHWDKVSHGENLRRRTSNGLSDKKCLEMAGQDQSAPSHYNNVIPADMLLA